MSIDKDKARKEIVYSILPILAIGLLTFVLNLYWNPRFNLGAFRADISVFQYAGKLITQGKLPYRDFWDHKPPAIYYVDAFEFLLMGVTPWATWWSNIVWVTLTISLYFMILRKLTDPFPALLASGAFLFTLMDPPIYGGGDLTEIYGLLPQVLIIGACFLYFKKQRKRWAFVLGLITAIAFLFKQTCIALGISAAATILYLAVRSGQTRRGLIALGLFTLGVILPLGLIALLWFLAGGLSELWDAVIVFNLLYVGSSISSTTFVAMFQILLTEFPLMPLTIAALGGLIAYLLANRTWLFSHGKRGLKPEEAAIPNDADSHEKSRAFLVVFLALPIEVAFVAMGGRNYPHYYVTLLPVFAAATAYLYAQLISVPYFNRRGLKGIAVLLLALVSLVWFSVAYSREKPPVGLRTSLSKPLYGDLPQSGLGEFVLAHSRPDESILIWKNDINLYLQTGRRNASRYLYPQPLFFPTSGGPSRFDQFLQDLQQDPPALIIGPTQAASDAPFVTSPDDQLCPDCIPEALEGMRRFKSLVTEDYAVIYNDHTTIVYQRVH